MIYERLKRVKCILWLFDDLNSESPPVEPGSDDGDVIRGVVKGIPRAIRGIFHGYKTEAGLNIFD